VSTATTTSPDTGQQTSPRGLHRKAQQPLPRPHPIPPKDSAPRWTLWESPSRGWAFVRPSPWSNARRLRQMVARDFEQIQASVGELLVNRPRRNILRRGQAGAGV
jgi:hypothetical protein